MMDDRFQRRVCFDCIRRLRSAERRHLLARLPLERAPRVIILAWAEAGRFRHDFVGPEHILLGLIRDSEGVATSALQRLGLRLETVKDKVERVLRAFPVVAPTPKSSPSCSPVTALASTGPH